MVIARVEQDGTAGDGRLDESVLVAAALDDPQAFGRLYDRHIATVYRYLYARTGSRETAEDLASQTFMRALSGLAHFRAGQPFLPWLLTIAHNTLIDHRRASARAVRLFTRLVAMRPEVSTTPAYDDDTAEFLALTEGLPTVQRDALALRFLIGLDVAEVAVVVRRSRDATRMMLFRALRTLRARAEQEERR
jgi:RNA polymerase sigma-70 factor (ECF subfamily)